VKPSPPHVEERQLFKQIGKNPQNQEQRKSRRRPAGHVIVVLATMVLVFALVMASSSAAGQSTGSFVSPVKDDPAFRRQLTANLVAMEQVAKKLQATREGRAAFAQIGFDPSIGFLHARHAARGMTPVELAVLKRALSAYPSWRTLPQATRKLANHMQRGHSGRELLRIPDDCVTARQFGWTQTDVELAADLAYAADAVLTLVPTDTIALPARLFAVGLWAIPTAALRALLHSYNIAQACDAADQAALLKDMATAITRIDSRVDVAVSTRASQTSLDEVKTLANNTSVLINSRLDVAVSTRASQASLDVFHNEFTTESTLINNSLTSISTSLTNLATTIADDQKLNLRLKIEEDLSEPNKPPIVLFTLPASAGGYLELAHTIVLDTIAKVQAAGLSTTKPNALLTLGDAALSRREYKAAYILYAGAYRAAG
jgi:hypothetical protein